MQEQAPTFRDATELATAATVALAAVALLDAGLFAFGVAHAADGAAPPKAIRDLHFLIRIATAFAFIAWLNRVYANVAALHGETAHERFWAIAGFFIPPFFAFRPCEITAEAWRRSSPSDDPPIFVYAWWTAFVLAPILALLGRTPMSQLIGIAAAVLAIIVVRRITSRQLAARNALAASARAQAMAERRSRMAGTATVPGDVAVEAPSETPASPPAPPPAPPQIAPHLAALDEANARRAAERREAAAMRMPSVQTPRTLETPKPASAEKATLALPSKPTTRPIAPQSHDDVWARIISVTVSIAALTMLAVAGAIMLRPDSQVVAGVYAAFALILLVVAIVVGRHRAERNALPDGWVKIAIFGMAVVAANIIVSIGAAVR